MKHLIIYTTKYGSVAHAAELLAKELGGDITIVNLKQNTPAPELKGFDTVSLGGSIYMGKVQKELRAFMHCHNKELLSVRKLGLFVCAGEDKEPRRTQQFEQVWPEELFAYATVKGIFGQEVHWEKASFLDRLAMRLIKGITGSLSALDQQAIKAFAEKLSR